MIPDDVLPQVLPYQRNAPVDVAAIANNFGLRIFQDTLPSGVSGKLWKNPSFGTTSGFVIIVSKAESLFRQRFTAAHEIGHFILHKHMIGEGIEENYLLRAKGVSTKEEVDANQFAADLLMPFPLIETLVETNNCTNLKDLANALQVSEIAMAIRLGYPT